MPTLTATPMEGVKVSKPTTSSYNKTTFGVADHPAAQPDVALPIEPPFLPSERVDQDGEAKPQQEADKAM